MVENCGDTFSSNRPSFDEDMTQGSRDLPPETSVPSFTMENSDEELAHPGTLNTMLVDLRELSTECRDLLHQISAENEAEDRPEARELMASFNIWTANMGTFREGQQSMASRLRSAPQIRELVQQLLVVLKLELGNSPPPLPQKKEKRRRRKKKKGLMAVGF